MKLLFRYVAISAALQFLVSPWFAFAEYFNDQEPTKQIVIGIPHHLQNPDKLYPTKLLRASLAASGTAFQLKIAPIEMSQDRNIHEISHGNTVDVFWTMTSIEREKTLRPIRIPIYKGLYGWRLLLVRQDDRCMDHVTKLSDLKKFIFLQGHDWPDTDILKANKLKVLTSEKYQYLYGMMQKKRGDIFPRSVLEINDERFVVNHQLIPHPSVLLYYPTALYFFVRKDNEELAVQIENGLNKLIASGEFDRMFQEEFADELKESFSVKRTVITLENPYLPPETPLHRSELWQFPQNKFPTVIIPQIN